MSVISDKKGVICDMDGVIYHDNELLPNVPEFIDHLIKTEKKFLFLTNSSERSPKELQQKLSRLGIEIDESHFYTSALATAAFLKKQSVSCSAYVIGEPGLINALYDQGITMNDVNPDYVVVGETRTYTYDKIAKAVTLVRGGAKLIGTNFDLTGPGAGGRIIPACRALLAPIELATGRTAYYLGKPNPLMVKTGIDLLGVDPKDSVLVGDRMDTDIICGIEAEIDTVLVLTGVSTIDIAAEFPYRPKYIVRGVGDLID